MVSEAVVENRHFKPSKDPKEDLFNTEEERKDISIDLGLVQAENSIKTKKEGKKEVKQNVK